MAVSPGKTLLVIGGGAAGFFTAINAAIANPRLQVIIAEKSNKLLGKVKVSGGGRCNVTHHCFDISEMIKRYPRGSHFLKQAFHRFFTTDTIGWFEQRKVKLKAEADGRMFPVTDDSQTIVNCLLSEADRLGITIWMQSEVTEVQKADDESFKIRFSGNRELNADFVCFANGGSSKLAGFSLIQRLGHTVIPPVPSLFTFNMPGVSVTQLMGVVVPDVQVKIAGTKWQQTGPVLITHWGLSGPCILRLSAWAARDLADMQYDFSVLINWLPLFNENSVRSKLQQYRFDLAAQKMQNRNPFGLPANFWLYLLVQSGVKDDTRWSDLPAKSQNILAKNLCASTFLVKGKTTFKEEFVTAGGVDLREVDPQTMQSRKVPGVYFAGEVLDVDGVTGGFNFQNAWTTGWVAAQAIAASV